MLFVVAWRNLWRNTRRTFVTMSAVAGGLTMILIANGFMHAMTDRMLEGLTSSYLGHVQIHREGYREKRGPALTVVDADRVLAAVRATDGVEAAAGRVYGVAHASIVRSGDDAAVRRGAGEDVAAPVVMLLGVEPEHEGRVTDLAARVAEGRWLEGDLDVVVGAGLARRNGIRVGDAFLPTSADGAGAVRGPWAVGDEVPRVVGVARTGMEDLDDGTAFVSRRYLAALQRMEGDVHEIAVRVDGATHPDLQKLDGIVARVAARVAAARRAATRPDAVTATLPLAVGLEADGDAPARTDAPDAGPAAGAADTRPRLRLVGLDVTLSEGGPVAAPAASAGLEGRLVASSDEILLSAAAAREVGARVGARVVVDVPIDCGPGVPAADCPPSAETFRVAGVVTPRATPALFDGRFAFVATSVLRDNLGALAPALLADLGGDDGRLAAAASRDLRGAVDARDEVLAWYGMAPELMAMLAAMDAGPLVFLFIIFVAVGVGIVNTMLMATFERTRELGVMMALGMRPRRVVALVMVESALLGLLGVAAGLALGSALVGYWSVAGATIAGDEGFSFSGVTFDSTLWPRLTAADLVKAGVPVFVMTSLAGLWPAIVAARLRVTEALGRE